MPRGEGSQVGNPHGVLAHEGIIHPQALACKADEPGCEFRGQSQDGGPARGLRLQAEHLVADVVQAQASNTAEGAP